MSIPEPPIIIESLKAENMGNDESKVRSKLCSIVRPRDQSSKSTLSFYQESRNDSHSQNSARSVSSKRNVQSKPAWSQAKSAPRPAKVLRTNSTYSGKTNDKLSHTVSRKRSATRNNQNSPKSSIHNINVINGIGKS